MDYRLLLQAHLARSKGSMNDRNNCNYYNLVKQYIPAIKGATFLSMNPTQFASMSPSPCILDLHSNTGERQAPIWLQKWSHSSPSCVLGEPGAAASRTWEQAWLPEPTV